MALFEVGSISAHPGYAKVMRDGEESFWDRYISGDWGDVPDELRIENNNALKSGKPLYAVYKLSSGTIVTVQTAGNRRSTFINVNDGNNYAKWNSGIRLVIRMTASAFIKELFGK